MTAPAAVSAPAATAPGAEAQVEAVLGACGFELLHTAFLVHDDLIDGETVRRGHPNLAATLRTTALDGGMGAALDDVGAYIRLARD